MTRGLACARVGLLPILIGAWAPWALAQSSGIVWEAGFEPIHTVTASWGGDRAVPSSFDQLATLAPGPDGNVYFFARNTSGQPVLSLLSSVDDTVIRQRTVASQQLGSYYDTLGGQSLGDGGALILRRGVTRFSSDGRLLWSRRIEAARFQPARVARFSNGDLVMTDQQTEDRAHKGWSIYRIDSLTGAVLNVRHFPSDATYGCAAIPLGVQSDDHVYVTDRCSDGTYRQRLIKLTPNLEPVWTRQWSASSAFDWMPNAGLIDAQGVVLERIGTTGRRELVRFRGGDGSIAWSRAGDWTALQAGSDGRWAGYVSNEDDRRLEGLDASTGAATWSHAVDVQDPILRIADNDVWIAGVDAAAAQGFVERRSLADGSILWRRELAGTQPGIYFRPGDVLVSEDQVRVAGESCPTDSSCAFGIKRLSRVTGNLQATSYPTSPQAASSDAAQDGDQWLAASLEDDPQGARVRAKRFDANGVLTWEHVFPADSARGRYQWARVRRMPDGDLLVVAGGRICCGHFARYSGDGETLRWRRSLTTDFYSPGHVAFDLDDAGDLIVSVSRNSGTGVYYGWIEKLDGASGVTLWRGGDAPSQLIDSGPRRFWLIGNDVFTFGAPHDARCGLLLSGSDGSRRWTDQCEFSSAFLGAQDGDIYLWAADGSISAVSVADGSVRWRRDVTGVGDEYAFVSGLVDGGDLYVGGSRVDGSGRAALLARIDRATGMVAWINQFAGPLGPPRAPITVREMSGGGADRHPVRRHAYLRQPFRPGRWAFPGWPAAVDVRCPGRGDTDRTWNLGAADGRRRPILGRRSLSAGPSLRSLDRPADRAGRRPLGRTLRIDGECAPRGPARRRVRPVGHDRPLRRAADVGCVRIRASGPTRGSGTVRPSGRIRSCLRSRRRRHLRCGEHTRRHSSKAGSFSGGFGTADRHGSCAGRGDRLGDRRGLCTVRMVRYADARQCRRAHAGHGPDLLDGLRLS